MIQGTFLSIILAVVIIAFFVMDFYFMSAHDRERSETGKGWSWDYTLFAMAFGLVILLQPVLFPKLGWTTSAFPGIVTQAVGGICIVLGFTLHIWARQHLRHFYTERVEVQKEHQIIMDGPYAYMRHPVFTAFFLLAGGILFINPAITTAIMFVYALIDFNKAAQQEEALLCKTVPGYEKYMTQVPRFFPQFQKSR